ncbi:MAG: hypothetical protein V1835_03925 [Candidatus Micrarchaeota archaeon]
MGDRQKPGGKGDFYSHANQFELSDKVRDKIDKNWDEGKGHFGEARKGLTDGLVGFLIKCGAGSYMAYRIANFVAEHHKKHMLYQFTVSV